MDLLLSGELVLSEISTGVAGCLLLIVALAYAWAVSTCMQWRCVQLCPPFQRCGRDTVGPHLQCHSLCSGCPSFS